MNDFRFPKMPSFDMKFEHFVGREPSGNGWAGALVLLIVFSTIIYFIDGCNGRNPRQLEQQLQEERLKRQELERRVEPIHNHSRSA